MNIRSVFVGAAVAVAASVPMSAVLAQAAGSPPVLSGSGAGTRPVAAPGAASALTAAPAALPHAMTPAEQRDSAAVPDDRRPATPAVPQLSFPLGKTPTSPVDAKPLPGMPPSSGNPGVNDDVARCEAQPDNDARARCRERLARSGRAR